MPADGVGRLRIIPASGGGASDLTQK